MALLLTALLLTAPASALETEISTGVFYFTDNAQKKQAAETEVSEGGLRFEASRDPRDVARDNASEEIRLGNVCLKQASKDLHAAVKDFRVREMCNELYKDELAATVAMAAQGKLHPDVFRCYAEAEAYEKDGFIRLNLAFHGQLATHQPVPVKLQRAGFPDEPVNWTLATHDAPGTPEPGWKGAVKEGACSFNDAALEKFIKGYRARKHDEAALARCQDEHARQLDRVKRLQAQFKEYVPDEWLKEAGGAEETAALLTPPVGIDNYADLKECQAGLARATGQFEKLADLSGKIAGHHDLPALDVQKQATVRSPASVEEEE